MAVLRGYDHWNRTEITKVGGGDGCVVEQSKMNWAAAVRDHELAGARNGLTDPEGQQHSHGLKPHALIGIL